jgi:glycine/D-amino acid oxidase-like deaminating enzyme/nitrite reductase/ring-hydroxylating ferredoxin subunit
MIHLGQLKSLWELTAKPAKSFPPYLGRSSTQVVVVGGGISGITTAYLLGKAGIDVVLLEARTIGSGTTGRSTGNLYSLTATPLAKMLTSYGLCVTKDMLRSRAEAIDFIERTVRENEISCNFLRVGFHYYLENRTESGLVFLQGELKAAERCGLAAEMLPRSPLPFPTQGILQIGGQAQIHPLRYVRGLAENMPANVKIYENSPIVDFDAARGAAITAHGEVRGKHLILATHVPKGFFPVQTMLRPEREMALSMRTRVPTLPGGIFWQVDPSNYSLRVHHEGGDLSYLLLIGQYHKTRNQGEHFDPFHPMRSYLSERFSVDDHFHGWGAQAYMPADALPFIGHVKDRLYYMTGYGADGLVFGTLAAQIISDQICKRYNRWQRLYAPCRFQPLKSASGVVKEAANNACHYAKDWLGTPTSTLAGIEAGKAGVIKHKGERLAVYRVDAGRVHCVSAVCTHLKCIVGFNPIEKSWDCPCHGSRFSIDGRVIEGPALRNLEDKLDTISSS